jgi:hypothetical protein
VRCVPFGLRFNHGWEKKHVAVQSEKKQATQAKGRHPSSFPISQNGVKMGLSENRVYSQL